MLTGSQAPAAHLAPWVQGRDALGSGFPEAWPTGALCWPRAVSDRWNEPRRASRRSRRAIFLKPLVYFECLSPSRTVPDDGQRAGNNLLGRICGQWHTQDGGQLHDTKVLGATDCTLKNGSNGTFYVMCVLA